MAKKQSGNTPSSLASGILSGRIKNPTPTQVKTLAGSVMGQDETRGARPTTPPKKK